MKNFNKTLLVAALLASSAGANAAIEATSNTGANEAFLSVYDKTQKTTFTLDLGPSATYSDFFNNLTNTAFSLSFDLNALTSGSSNAKWSTFAAGLDLANTSWGVMTTSGPRTFTTGESTINKFGTLALANAVSGAIRNHAGQINTGALADNTGASQQATANLSSIVVDSDTSGTGQHNKIGPFATIFGQVAAADADINGNEGAFWLYNSNAGNSLAVQTWNMDLAGGKLTYGAAPAAVPLPAAVWMFGAGLMGVLRLNRRKSAA